LGGDVSALGVEEAAATAVKKAKESAAPASWPPGKYTVILEPAAVAGLIGPMAWGGMGAKETHEGRTFLAGKLGQKLVSERVTLVSDPFHPQLNGRPWFGDGLRSRKVVWIDHGKFVNLSYDRFTAKKHGQEPTPDVTNLVMEGGADTLDGLIAGTERGILITHFWYIRFVDPMTMLLTGMTRDGLFAIENGKITGGLKNFRWNMSTVDMLANIQGMTASGPASDVETSLMILPALKVSDWNFTSSTTF
jgi:predicted Zn-dependent protease